ncbi:flagellin [Peribacillus psychrosaccharolyticus]|uniref:Flagellin n=1 Tax=Peribacillus psychrosaccharolyticus TaxID=1407 RepID=A0A974NK37_PERPY|nr:flagellin [Peribacillus psychrosaccharolyticus]MEC2055489.1 flagellin [Peribacillus psychrosaccharolyticus]MED3743483.1 flagellin [Peribacillus psychrosaccharolyticus]QQS99166.1 flagellin [Peribacillus psychrosaccharolyticus]
MKINHNISALNAYRNLTINNTNTSKSMEKLSSGLRINRASDDAAGLAISEKMRSQIRGLDMAERNALDGISLIQTAEGALSSTHEILQRMRELSVQSANGTYKNADREEIQKEMVELTAEIDRIAKETEFNSSKLLTGGTGGSFAFQIGANSGQKVELQIGDMSSTGLKLNGVDVSTVGKAEGAITKIDAAIQQVSSERARLGAVQNRLEYTVDNLGTMSENLTAAESRIRDLDMALEMTNFTKNNIMNQAAQSMLAQANQLPQGVLQLLK